MLSRLQKFFDKRMVFSIILGLLSVLVIVFSVSRIQFSTAVVNMLPANKDMARNVSLMEKSPLSDKVVLYIHSDKAEDLYLEIEEFKNLVSESLIPFTNTIPDEKDINEIMEYCQKNSLLLYPYESRKNPFTKENIRKGLASKTEYMESMPFFNPDEAFFMDPLFMGFDVLKTVNASSQNKFNSKYGGIVSEDGKSYMLVLKSGIFPNDYRESEKIVDLDKNVKQLAEKHNCRAFILSSHLYYQESYQSLQVETSIMFILSTVFTLFIFFFFFRNIKILYYSLLPMILGIALTFLCIAVFKRNFGGIAFGFGSTILGISSDYTIHYLVKRQTCTTLKDTDTKIGKALLLGFITTIAPLMILPFSGIVSLQEIALLGILSVGFSFVFTWFLLRHLAPPGDNCSMRIFEFRFFGLKGFVAFLVLIVPFIAACFFLRFENNISNLDKVHPEMNKRVAIIKEAFGYTSDTTMLCFSGKTKDEVFAKSLDALNFLDNRSVPGFLSPALFVPDSKTLDERKIFIRKNYSDSVFKSGLNESVFDNETFTEWETAVKNIDDLSISGLPSYVDKEINSMVTSMDGLFYLLIPIQNRDHFNRIRTELKNGKIDFFAIDLLNDNAPGLLMVEKIAMTILMISLAVIFVILLVAYRNIAYTLLAMLPALTGLVGCFGISAMIGKPINIMHIVASMILIGICVDYGVFVTSSYRDYHGKDGINITFLSIFICALVTLAGFGALMISSNQAMFTLGLSVFFGIFFSFVTSWLVIPYFMRNRVK